MGPALEIRTLLETDDDDVRQRFAPSRAMR
jgi:hypothetical protein